MDKLEKYIEKLEKIVELEDKALRDMMQLREEIEMFNDKEDKNEDCE